jgi:hypothetical protein
MSLAHTFTAHPEQSVKKKPLRCWRREELVKSVGGGRPKSEPVCSPVRNSGFYVACGREKSVHVRNHCKMFLTLLISDLTTYAAN